MLTMVSKKLCWVMIVVLLVTWSQLPALAQQKTGSPSVAERKQAAEKLERLFDALEEASREIPRDTFDPMAVIQKVGYDPEALFAWVRDNTYLVPYRGVLRGPIGVLMDRRGNSLDRALLLHKLLSLAGQEVRLARGILTEKQAEELLEKARPIPESGVTAITESSPQDMEMSLKRYSRKYQLDSAELRRAMDNIILREQHLAEKLVQQVDQQCPQIAAMVGVPNRQMQITELLAKAIKDYQDHWWVQLRQEYDWVDMDPTLPVVWSDQVPRVAQETYGPNNLANELFHLVQIRVVIEQWLRGELKEREVLKYKLLPSELIGERITFCHYPMHSAWSKKIHILDELNPIQSLYKEVLKENEWLPVLIVGDKHIFQSSFTNTGNINKEPVEGPYDFIEKLRQPWGRITDPLAGRESLEDQEKESYLTAEWIDYQIIVPGENVKTIRREVFDLVGPAKRSRENINPKQQFTKKHKLDFGLKLLEEINIFIQVCQLSTCFIRELMSKSLLTNKNILLDLLKFSEKKINDYLTDRVSKITPPPGQEYNLVLARSKWSRFNKDIYIGKPNIFTYYKGIRHNLQNDIIYHGFDIIDNEIDIFPVINTNPFLIRLEQGILETNAEALLIGMFGETSESIAEVFTKANALNINLLIIKDKFDPELNNLHYPNDLKTRIEMTLNEKDVVVIPQKAITINTKKIIGFWRINPTTGHSVGISRNGRGGTYAEYNILLNKIALAIGGISCVLSGATCKDNFIRKMNGIMCLVAVISISLGYVIDAALYGMLGSTIGPMAGQCK